MNRYGMLYVLVVDGVKCSFALSYERIVKVLRYNQDKYPEKLFSFVRVK